MPKQQFAAAKEAVRQQFAAGRYRDTGRRYRNKPLCKDLGKAAVIVAATVAASYAAWRQIPLPSAAWWPFVVAVFVARRSRGGGSRVGWFVAGAGIVFTLLCLRLPWVQGQEIVHISVLCLVAGVRDRTGLNPLHGWHRRWARVSVGADVTRAAAPLEPPHRTAAAPAAPLRQPRSLHASQPG